MINTREIAEEYRLSHWARIMRERVESGLSIKAYCKQIGICGNTYFYWQRRVRAAACEQLSLSIPENRSEQLPAPRFAEVRVTGPITEPVALPEAIQPSLFLMEIGGARITIDSTYPTDKLAALLRELGRPC